MTALNCIELYMLSVTYSFFILYLQLFEHVNNIFIPGEVDQGAGFGLQAVVCQSEI